MGYHRAGFEVVGVDHVEQPNYPFEFHQADAMTYPFEGFDIIHASPPCQHYSQATSIRNNADDYPDLVPATQERLRSSGLPYVIENVVGAPLEAPLVLCGTMFPGLRVKRHRLFESNLALYAPPHGLHPRVFYRDRRRYKPGYVDWDGFVMVVGNNCPVDVARDAMGIDWMARLELTQAIPPAYTQFLGEQLIRHLAGDNIVVPEQEQVCSRCKRTLPVSEFSKDRRRSNGIAGKCKSCKNVTDKRNPHYGSPAEHRGSVCPPLG